MPDEETLSERGARGLGLCRPELAVLLAHTKISLYAELIKSDLPNDPLFEADLLRYFPRAMQERFREEILAHPLRREIIATVVVNSMVNRIGSGVVNEMQDRTGASDADVARAYAVARDLSGANDIWDAMAGAGKTPDAATRIDVLVQTRDAVEAMACWLLRNVAWPIGVYATVGRFLPAITRFRQSLADTSGPDRDGLSPRGDLSPDVRRRVAVLPRLVTALDIARIAETTAVDLDVVCRYVLAADERLGVARLLGRLAEVRAQDALEGRVLAGVREEVAVTLRDLVARALMQSPGNASVPALEVEARATRFASIVSAYLEQPESGLMAAVACAQDLRALAA